MTLLTLFCGAKCDARLSDPRVWEVMMNDTEIYILFVAYSRVKYFILLAYFSLDSSAGWYLA